MPAFFKIVETFSELSIEAVPTKIGASFLFISLISVSNAVYLSSSFTYTTSLTSSLTIVWFVGMTTTLIL